MRKPDFLISAQADQRSFVNRYIESMVFNLVSYNISISHLVCVAEQAGLSLLGPNLQGQYKNLGYF